MIRTAPPPGSATTRTRERLSGERESMPVGKKRDPASVGRIHGKEVIAFGGDDLFRGEAILSVKPGTLGRDRQETSVRRPIQPSRDHAAGFREDLRQVLRLAVQVLQYHYRASALEMKICEGAAVGRPRRTESIPVAGGDHAGRRGLCQLEHTDPQRSFQALVGHEGHAGSVGRDHRLIGPAGA